MLEKNVVRQISKFIEDWVPTEASVAIAGGDKYVTYIPGSYDIQISHGQPIPTGSITERVYLQRSRVETMVDKSVFGIPYYGVGYPLEDLESGFNGALTVILPPEYSFKKHTPFSFIVGKRDDIWSPIPVEQISYIESNQKKTLIYTEDGYYSSIYPLKVLEQRLPDSFIRIHRSYIVNISYIKQISRDLSSNLLVKLKIPETPTLIISQTYIQRVRKVLGF
jgi:two-component system, LytTR family, response regulator LytT